MKKNSLPRLTAAALVLLTLIPLVVAAGCGKEAADTARTSTRVRTVTTPTATTPAPAVQGITVDPNLQSATGTPNPDEMKALIALQGKVPYPVMVPTQLPGGYQLEKDLIGSSGPTAKDPTGYYSFRYADPGNQNRTLTFNQSRANAKPLSGYYLTEEVINGVTYQVYWHKTLEYLPAGDPVRTDSVGEAETFVVVWKGSYNDAAGQPQELYYSLNTGTWTGHGWGDIRYILENLKPVGGVG